MSIETEIKFQSPEQISQMRIERLKNAMDGIKQRIPEEEMAKIDAVIVYGSTALNMANETSDVDVFITFKGSDQPQSETLRNLVGELENALPGILVSCNLGPLILRGRSTKSITLRSAKHPERYPKWVFIYTRDTETQAKLENILVESQKFWESTPLNRPRRPTQE